MHYFLTSLILALPLVLITPISNWPTLAQEVSPEEEFPRAPEFRDVTDWINGQALKMSDQKNKVTIIAFWTHGCINCVHNYPHLRAWQEKFKNTKEVTLVGIHTPEFDSEKDVKKIAAQADKHQLKFLIAVDNSGANWRAWQNHYWPCVYVVDGQGKVRYRWEGELGEEGYKKVTSVVEAALKELPKKN
ncbi:redoxin domain-containing protein [Telmatocola sphagniphila]|uniref:Redoxin domain-containing protein n=1 Tax=Telmatocola sphagniphila TaxID=1123043 RepID=A0A8E6B4I7_9BACT|nr:redoxin domain-containing protein [Telmatocola sphagniphila]QVL30378.1 redoxin domain-containing protein [Telmatocola sphagniphila]